MIAIAVRRLRTTRSAQFQQAGRHRIALERDASRPDVTGEDQLTTTLRFVNAHRHNGRAKDMAGVGEPCCDSRSDFTRLAVRQRLKVGPRPIDVLGRAERVDEWFSLAHAVAVSSRNVGLLEMAASSSTNSATSIVASVAWIGPRSRAGPVTAAGRSGQGEHGSTPPHRADEGLSHQPAGSSGRHRENPGIDPGQSEPGRFGLNQIARAGDLARRTEKRQPHEK